MFYSKVFSARATGDIWECGAAPLDRFDAPKYGFPQNSLRVPTSFQTDAGNAALEHESSPTSRSAKGILGLLIVIGCIYGIIHEGFWFLLHVIFAPAF